MSIRTMVRLHNMELCPWTPSQGGTASARREHSPLCPSLPHCSECTPKCGQPAQTSQRFSLLGMELQELGYGQAQGCS